MECGNMGLFDRGVQMLLTTVGAFAAFSLMTIAVGTDYWLYSRGVCKTKSMSENETSKKNEEVMTHSGLWRTCCLEGKRLLDWSHSASSSFSYFFEFLWFLSLVLLVSLVYLVPLSGSYPFLVWFFWAF